MALSATLQTRQSQSLVMTPQLMQSIRLLQLTHAELEQYIERELEKNPLLEKAGDAGLADGPGQSERQTEGPADEPAPDMEGDWFRQELDQDGDTISARLDAAQEDIFPEDSGPVSPDAPELAAHWKSMPGASTPSTDAMQDIDGYSARPQTLRDHVNEQIIYTFPGSKERLIAAHIADHLDAAGYLDFDPAQTAEQLNVDAVTVEKVLIALQGFDPAGLFARSLSECLANQLRRKNRLDPAMDVLVGNLDLLARRDFKTLRKMCGVDEADLLDMLAEIKALDPKPGNRFDTAHVQAVVADVIVRPASGGDWSVELNAETLPRVLVNRSYYSQVSSAPGQSAGDREYLNECLKNANWLTRSLDQRARTIMKVAGEIVRRQTEFLSRGVQHLRPMTLKSVADEIGMHESTVSRVTSNKYISTPRGLYELKFFFTAAIAASNEGDSHSSEAVRHRIRGLIDGETAEKVLSDDVIVGLLQKEGIDIARRTVAKYREGMNIASSVQRRREKRALARAGL
ncbi:RNA polymerase factor sigma-54 [Hoeflea prorocentri]|uniref:RNA polymerase sigma-54 factor n=1 Tax=Hoeflea prorocentri TaxID=1922333 RepID=A0A9X3ULF5_9HYPH|nr:RNA polymerase factor sigma-54 [Hoeflea prorocentri]MCY6382779.1 RNA polymerase factor sigma-54 [Hoeflea prorocentri]MDA5400579.1 RNA polymerase factor sigma-54 [Hoeflea prorocentri]